MLLRTRICIPSFNHPTTVEPVIEECLTQTPFPVVVVDDGSHLRISNILRQESVLMALQSKRLEIITLPKNKGKGAAIQEAMKSSLKKGFTHLITIDSDGQHLVEDVMGIARKISQHPMAIVLGYRRNRKRWGFPSILRLWLRYETRQTIRDVFFGLRAYPLFFCQDMSTLSKRFFYEIEILKHLSGRGVEFTHYPASVWQAPQADSISHFLFVDRIKKYFICNALIALLPNGSLCRLPSSIHNNIDLFSTWTNSLAVGKLTNFCRLDPGHRLWKTKYYSFFFILFPGKLFWNQRNPQFRPERSAFLKPATLA